MAKNNKLKKGNDMKINLKKVKAILEMKGIKPICLENISGESAIYKNKTLHIQRCSYPSNDKCHVHFDNKLLTSLTELQNI